MSTRRRSVVAAGASTLIAVFVLGAAVDVLVARHLHAALDHTLRARAVEVAQLAASTPALLTSPGALDSPVGATQAMVGDARRRYALLRNHRAHDLIRVESVTECNAVTTRSFSPSHSID